MDNERIDNLRDELAIEEPEVETPSEETPEADTTVDEERPETVDEPSDEGTGELPVPKTDEFQMPKKFKGKTAEEIAQSYLHLEKRIGGRNITKDERKVLKDAGIDPKDLPMLEKIKQEITGMDFEQGMTPQQFAIWLAERMAQMVESQTRNVYQATTKVQAQVKSEITAAKEKYPLLGVNKEFNDFVISVLQKNAEEGNEMPLEEACGLVTEKIESITKATSPQVVVPKKKAPTTLETQNSPTIAVSTSDQEAVINGIFNAGPKSGTLGGL